MAEAMRGIVPPAILGRATKGEFGQDLRQGLADNLPAILNLSSPTPHWPSAGSSTPTHCATASWLPNATSVALEALLGCELWLRNAARPAPQPREHDAPAPAP
ncbi:hypothetical protein [Streptomyces coeruleorubidus]|uniref:hypothetical protein n=1 Tax=Streptomyces coeruleorubidus TaxID=116188 RepID=UPI0033F42E26